VPLLWLTYANCAEEQVLQKKYKAPGNYPLADGAIVFAHSTAPMYGAEVAKALHPTVETADSEDATLILTHMISNPVPRDFSVESIALLKNLLETEEDALLVSRPVNFWLVRKWNSYAYRFYLI
jgi:hypothetical protein